ncbi:MAG: hypothetical protein V3V61_06505 [Gammaproteobacteria bacterium]
MAKTQARYRQKKSPRRPVLLRVPGKIILLLLLAILLSLSLYWVFKPDNTLSNDRPGDINFSTALASNVADEDEKTVRFEFYTILPGEDDLSSDYSTSRK